MRRFGRLGLLAVLLFPILLNAPELTNVLKADPALVDSGLGINLKPALIGGNAHIDPSVGGFHEALGKRAAIEWARGKIPWWNSFEGAGVPLAGEMNSSPFYPLMPLLVLPHGQVFMQVAVQITAGIATALLLSELGLCGFVAIFGALLFEVNGTFAWLGGGWSYPIPCLPLLLYGIEKLRGAERRQRFLGGLWISISIALSISGGFIEIAYLNGLLGVVWATLRFMQAPRNGKAQFAARFIGSGIVGLLLAAPILVAFFDYLRVAIVGYHTGCCAGPLAAEGLPQIALPYIWGPIFHFYNANVAQVWAGPGGYAGFGLSALAISALFGNRERSLRWLLAAWIFLTVGAAYGLPVVRDFVTHWPGVRFTGFWRYFDASRDFGLVVLAMFAIDDSLTLDRQTLRTRLLTGLTAMAVFCWYGLASSWDLVKSLWPSAGYVEWFIASLQVAVGISAAMLMLSGWPNKTLRAWLLGIVVTAEAAAFYLIPTLSNPTGGALATGGVDFLTNNLGYQRMYSMGPIAPNYGSYFGTASINFFDLPMSKLWGDYVFKHLDPYANPNFFTGVLPMRSSGVPSPEEVLQRDFSGYEQAGVKYVLTSPGVHLMTTTVEPRIGTGVPEPLPLRSGASAHFFLPSVPAGRLVGIEILQATYDQTADGDLAIRICVRHVCANGMGPLSKAPNNKYFFIPFTSEASIPSSSAAVWVYHIGGTHAEALYVYPDASPVAERVTIDGRALQGKMVPIRLLYSSGQIETPVQRSSNEAYALPSGREAQIHLNGAIPAGEVDGVSIFQATYGGTADGLLKVRLCSGGDCAQSERQLRDSADNAYLQFQFKKPLMLKSVPATITLRHVGGKHPEALWLWPQVPGNEQTVLIDGAREDGKALLVRFSYVALHEIPSLVYADEAMEVYQLPHPTPYFNAAGCKWDALSRANVEAFCENRSTLRRLELWMPGWSATVNSRTVPIALDNDAFQAIDLPAGRSSVTFSFTPPYMDYGVTAFLVAVIAILFQLVFAFRSPLTEEVYRVDHEPVR